MTMKNDAKFEKELTCPFKTPHEFDKFWREYSRVSNIYSLNFWPKYTMFELKKYWGVMFHDTEEWCKIGRKIDL